MGNLTTVLWKEMFLHTWTLWLYQWWRHHMHGGHVICCHITQDAGAECLTILYLENYNKYLNDSFATYKNLMVNKLLNNLCTKLWRHDVVTGVKLQKSKGYYFKNSSLKNRNSYMNNSSQHDTCRSQWTEQIIQWHDPCVTPTSGRNRKLFKNVHIFQHFECKFSPKCKGIWSQFYGIKLYDYTNNDVITCTVVT